MSCEELREDYEMYAIGAAEDPVRAELAEHLSRGCTTCVSGVARARRMTAQIALSAPEVQPPARLKRRILASVGAAPARWSWTPVWAAVSALALFGAVYFYGRQRDTETELVRVRGQYRTQTIELARLNDAISFLNEPQTRQVIFGQGAPEPPRGNVFLNPGRGVLLIASNLPPAPAGKTYEMWVIPKGGNPVPAGLFQSDTSGNAIHVRRGPVDLAATGAVAVTVEDAAGAAQPTSTPLIVAKLG